MRTNTLTHTHHSPSRAVGHLPGQKGHRSVRRQIVPPALHIPDSAAASVFRAVRLRGPVGRDVIAGVTSLSIATVNRQVIALLEAGLLRERADLAVSGAIGRPRVPVEVNHEPFVTLGIHIGARTTSIVATDLFGRTLDTVETPTPRNPAGPALATLADSARRYLRRWHRRRPLWVGVAIGGTVDSATGQVDHPRLGWRQAPVGQVLADALGLPVSVASHVDAMAGAELLLGMRRFPPSSPTSLYVYARETVGYALVIGGRVHVPDQRPGHHRGPAGALRTARRHRPARVHRQRRGRPGRRPPAAHPAVCPGEPRQRCPRPVSPTCCGWPEPATSRPRTCSPSAGRVLGEAVALLRDMLNPDELVVGGQAFTEYPEAMEQVEAAFVERSVLGPRDIRLTAFGNRVQEAGAGTVSLSGLYADPLGAMRRAGALDARLHDVARDESSA